MFQQLAAPVGGSLLLSALCAALPLLVLFVLLGIFRVKAHQAALAGLLTSVALALFVWRMPVGQTLSATTEGFVYGLVPILWILVNALWIYKMTVATSWFDVLGRTIRSISNDLRILAIIVAFCFGALLESLAGFGAPVAITAAMLMAAGMKPLKSAAVSLLANTAPVAFGSMGTPIIALHGVTGIPLQDLSSMAGRQTPLIALLVPLLLVFIVDGWRGVRQTWPIAIVAGVTFGVAQFLTSNFVAVELTDVVASVATACAVLVMLRFWQPAEIIGIHDGADSADADGAHPTPTEARDLEDSSAGSGATGPATAVAVVDEEATKRPATSHVWMAVAPYLVIIAVFSLAQIPALKDWLTAHGSVTFHWPGLDVVDTAGKAVGAQKFKLDHLKAAGSLLLLSGIISMAIYRISPRRALRLYGDTLVQLRWTIVTVTAVLGLSFVMNLSGQTATLGLALASAGGVFAAISPVLGWIGVALTGSDTSSNSLFGQLQVTAAEHTGLSPVLMAAANSSAGVMGKMLSLQNLAVASAAVGVVGSESALFRRLLGWSLALLAIITLLIVLQSTPILGWMVP
ncbi:L-lactate permease [Mycobacterium sp. URHB0044]|uniref:L-lactate permease n=1 Tax=Mycobacterium sp. URHB0044 TaxID=1380386 RepID=UPI00048AC511|nr:L-lactate permease [Mycobacterium sp. URHB0044]